MDNGRQFVATNGIRLHVVQAGPADGPPVILLHGFPEFWYGWRHQIDFLAGLGFRIWAPDQRGYNLSDKPEGIAAYRMESLAADVIGLIDAIGDDPVCLVGHDWGAAVAWWIANRYPHRLRRMVVINVPHPAIFQQRLKTSMRQWMKSWYIAFFQIPRLPEKLARTANWRMVTAALSRTSRSGTFTASDLQEYRNAWSQPGAFTSMLNWYRALARHRPSPPSDPRITVPTLLIWGVHDRFLEREMAQRSIDLCDNGKLVYFEDATHWVQHEEPDRVNGHIQRFLS